MKYLVNCLTFGHPILTTFYAKYCEELICIKKLE